MDINKCNCLNLAKILCRYDYHNIMDNTDIKKPELDLIWKEYKSDNEIIEYINRLSLLNIQSLYQECISCNCGTNKDSYPSLNNYLTEFISESDDAVFEENGISREDVGVFVKEIKTLFEKTWSDEYQYDLGKLSTGYISDLNKILNYPSLGGYHILEDSFTGPMELDGFSDTSKSLLGYFYGIHLH